MRILSLTLLATLAATGLAVAQETAPATPEQPAAEGTAAPPGLSMGETLAPDGGQIGTPYVEQTHGDWEIRCVRTESGLDPCQLYQLLADEGGNSVAEFAMFPLLPAQGDAVAGGTIITPLETLLTEQVTVSIDGGSARRYPFSFCTEIGCFARIGYSADDVTRFKRGASATVSIVPLVAPDQRVPLTLSLSGFTAGYDALVALMTERAEQARQQQGQ